MKKMLLSLGALALLVLAILPVVAQTSAVKQWVEEARLTAAVTTAVNNHHTTCKTLSTTINSTAEFMERIRDLSTAKARASEIIGMFDEVEEKLRADDAAFAELMVAQYRLAEFLLPNHSATEIKTKLSRLTNPEKGKIDEERLALAQMAFMAEAERLEALGFNGR